MHPRYLQKNPEIYVDFFDINDRYIQRCKRQYSRIPNLNETISERGIYYNVVWVGHFGLKTLISATKRK